jgi:arylsulfatase A-like enzyme
MKSSRRGFLKTAGVVAGSEILLSPFAGTIAAEEKPGSPRRPNILFFFPDQHRYDWIGSTAEMPVRTPNLDALGGRGIRFSRAVCASPLCAPSRACLAAGKGYDRCRVIDNGVDYPLENIDRWLGIYLEELRERGELENTLIVYSSDHGEMLGDRDLWGKSKPHQPSIGVPLVVAGPEVRKAPASDALVSVMDLAATFLDYGEAERPKEMDSRSMRPLLAGKESTHREFLFSGLYEWRTVFDGRYKLITGYPGKGSAMLFDLQEDPLENDDLASTRPEVVERLREAIQEANG